MNKYLYQFQILYSLKYIMQLNCRIKYVTFWQTIKLYTHANMKNKMMNLAGSFGIFFCSYVTFFFSRLLHELDYIILGPLNSSY